MLVLSRGINQDVMLDFSAMSDAELLALRKRPIVVRVTDIRKGAEYGQSVRLGFEAAPCVQIHRREIFEERKAAL